MYHPEEGSNAETSVVLYRHLASIKYILTLTHKTLTLILGSRQYFSKIGTNPYIIFPASLLFRRVYTVCYFATCCYEKVLCWFIRSERIRVSTNLNIMALDFHKGTRTNHYFFRLKQVANWFVFSCRLPGNKMKVSKDLYYKQLSWNCLTVTFQDIGKLPILLNV